MAETYQWNLSVAGQVTGTIIESSSEFPNSGKPGETVEPIVAFKNTGSVEGIIYVSLYEYPGTTDENLLDHTNITGCGPGATPRITMKGTIPNIPGQTWPLGVKVWGEDESEPGFTAGASLAPSLSGTHTWGLGVGEGGKGKDLRWLALLAPAALAALTAIR